MNKKIAAQRFSERLTDAMREKGYTSNRLNGNIDINLLANISGCSYQMARKYANGEVLPELYIVEKIAAYLGCHPSFLLFDDACNSAVNKSDEPLNVNIIEIDKFTLKYILSKSLKLLSTSKDTNDVVNFIVETVYDAAHLDVDQRTLYKIIDMMISSATLLNKAIQDDQRCIEQI